MELAYSLAEIFDHLGAWIRTQGCFEDYPELNVSDLRKGTIQGRKHVARVLGDSEIYDRT